MQHCEITLTLSTDDEDSFLLSHDQDIIHVGKGYAEMHDFCMTALMFLISHGLKQESMPVQKMHISQVDASCDFRIGHGSLLYEHTTGCHQL